MADQQYDDILKENLADIELIKDIKNRAKEELKNTLKAVSKGQSYLENSRPKNYGDHAVMD